MLAFQLRKQSWAGRQDYFPKPGLFPQLKHQHFHLSCLDWGNNSNNKRQYSTRLNTQATIKSFGAHGGQRELSARQGGAQDFKAPWCDVCGSVGAPQRERKRERRARAPRRTCCVGAWTCVEEIVQERERASAETGKKNRARWTRPINKTGTCNALLPWWMMDRALSHSLALYCLSLSLSLSYYIVLYVS